MSATSPRQQGDGDDAPQILESVGSSPQGWCDPASGVCAVPQQPADADGLPARTPAAHAPSDHHHR